MGIFPQTTPIFLQIKKAIVTEHYTSSTCGNSTVYIKADTGQELSKLQEIVKMIAPVCALFVLSLVAVDASARGDYFFEPVINIIQPNQEVKVDGCATPTMTLAFNSPINVRFSFTVLPRLFSRQQRYHGVEAKAEERCPAL